MVNLTQPQVLVAAAMMADPHQRHWGYELSRVAGVRSGVMYPVLRRWLTQGWLSDGWEDPSDTGGSRPPRRYYRITEDGLRELNALIARAEHDVRFASLLRERHA